MRICGAEYPPFIRLLIVFMLLCTSAADSNPLDWNEMSSPSLVDSTPKQLREKLQLFVSQMAANLESNEDISVLPTVVWNSGLKLINMDGEPVDREQMKQEMESTSNDDEIFEKRTIRESSGPSLSIVNPLDVLRKRLLLEITRRRMRQSQSQLIANAAILKNIGR